jgi:predicted secreted protein
MDARWGAAVAAVAGMIACCAALFGAAPPASGQQPPASGSPCDGVRVPDPGISVQVGDTFTVALPSNRTTGYSWALAETPDPAVLVLVSDTYVPPSAARPGAGGTECWTFSGVGAGTTTLSLVYRRPWETDTPPAQQVDIPVQVGTDQTGGASKP